MEPKKPARKTKWNAKPSQPIQINGTVIRVSRRVVLTIETESRIKRVKGQDSQEQ